MQTKILALLAIFCVGSLSRTAQVEGNTLPQSYPLLESVGPIQKIDPGLQEWINIHRVENTPFELSEKDFESLVGRSDPLVAAYLNLRKATAARKKKTINLEQTKEYQTLRSIVVDNEEVETGSKHPLAPWAYYQLMEASNFAGKDSALLAKNIFKEAPGCVHKKLIMEEMEFERMEKMSTDSLADILNRIDAFHSRRFKHNALNKFLGNLVGRHRPALKAKLFAMTESFSDLRRKNDWIEDVDTSKSKYSDVTSLFAEAELNAKRRRCTTARNQFQKALIKVGSSGLLEEAMDSAGKIEACFRRRGVKDRRGFWVAIEKPMEQAFAFDGWAKSNLRLGYLYWTSDMFKEAKERFQKVIAEAKKQKNRAYESDAWYALGRIAENEGDNKAALENYEIYTSQFPEGPSRQDALRSMVLIHIDEQDWQGGLKTAMQIVRDENELDIDARSLGPHAFALFWAGRIHFQLGNQRLAEELWQQVASEYYSTYYGALSHYMLEKVKDQKLVLEPARTSKFRMHEFLRAFNDDEKKAIRRTEALLRLGLHAESHCEITEVAEKSEPVRGAAISLLLYAAGEWLDAIKIYSAIPRSYRNSIPVGFERILFPRRYTDTIESYAKKLGVDPDLVFAVIRQESVFDPNAQSPAGARGLMQLMPATARLEAQRLKNSYLDQNTRQRLQRQVKRKNNLFDAETNLALGIHHLNSLLSKYKSPVFTLTAYNASPRATKRWQETIPTDDILAFIERIPYEETRGYVKLILRNYFYYKRWHSEGHHDFPHLEAVTMPVLTMADAKNSNKNIKKASEQ